MYTNLFNKLSKLVSINGNDVPIKNTQLITFCCNIKEKVSPFLNSIKIYTRKNVLTKPLSMANNQTKYKRFFHLKSFHFISYVTDFTEVFYIMFYLWLKVLINEYRYMYVLHRDNEKVSQCCIPFPFKKEIVWNICKINLTNRIHVYVDPNETVANDLIIKSLMTIWQKKIATNALMFTT